MTRRISECGYCRQTNFTGWYSKTAPKDRYGRLPLDYLDSNPVAYCSEEHRDAADKIRAQAFREAAEEIRTGRRLGHLVLVSPEEIVDRMAVAAEGGEPR